MLIDGMHVDHLRLILGTSMGCMQSLRLGRDLPALLRRPRALRLPAHRDRRPQPHVALHGHAVDPQRSRLEERRLHHEPIEGLRGAADCSSSCRLRPAADAEELSHPRRRPRTTSTATWPTPSSPTPTPTTSSTTSTLPRTITLSRSSPPSSPPSSGSTPPTTSSTRRTGHRPEAGHPDAARPLHLGSGLDGDLRPRHPYPRGCLGNYLIPFLQESAKK